MLEVSRSQISRTLPVLIASCLLALPAHAKYSGGSGTAQDPYKIATAADLIALGETPGDYDKRFILTADIDLDPKLPGCKVFDRAVIAPDTDPTKSGLQETSFTGIFDGKGHMISRLTIRGGWYLGLFGSQHGKVKDLGVVDVNIAGSGVEVGGLVGVNGGGVVWCYSTGAVSGAGDVGGLVGYNLGRASVADSYSTAAVSATDDVGGLIGSNGVWGLEGQVPGFVTRCYSTGAVRGTGEGVGGLLGSGDQGDYDDRGVADCFWDIETSGQISSAGGTGQTTTQMHDPNTFRAAGWDFVGPADGPDDLWGEATGGGYPVLWWQLSPLPKLPVFSGGTGEPNDPYLISTAKDLDNIGHNPRLVQCHYKLVADLDLADFHFHPIGNWDLPYGGIFDGNGHIVSHLTFEEDFGCVGLFGVLGSGAAVKDLGVMDVNISSPLRFGLFWPAGGLAASNSGTVSRCYSTGAVSGFAEVGGLVGGNSGTITRCYSTVSVISSRYDAGGLVGDNFGSVIQCYSTGAVTSTSAVGGLVGWNYGTVTASFWDTQTSGQTKSAGGTGKTTAQMYTARTFLDAGWDFMGETKNGTDDIWWILEGKDYPRLWWEAHP